jgi:hypothetical protein
MLLFRGTSWHQGLSSETVQAVMNQWYDWFDSPYPSMPDSHLEIKWLR